MSSEASEDRIWTPANIVTIVRICGVPIFVAALLSPWPQWFPFVGDNNLIKPLVAAIIFAILAGTDGVDGYLARSRNEVTTFGKFIDPLADKILVAAALLALVELGVLPSWVALIIISREFIISGLRMLAAAKGTVIAASWYGKAKTVTQIIAILMFLLKDFYVASDSFAPSNPLWILAWVIMLAAVFLTILSMVDYIYKARGMFGIGTEASGEKESSGNLPEEVVKALLDKNITVSTAESLTGGLIAASITAVPGSSAICKGGVVSYVNDVKAGVLGVSGEILNQQGAVCEDVARQMAEGSLKLTQSDIAVAVTGIAGPSGAEEGKPVGTVWMGVATMGGTTAQCYHFEGNRDEIRSQTVTEALKAILRTVQ